MTDLHDRLDDLAGDAPAVLPESDLWLRGRRFRRSQQRRRFAVTAAAAAVAVTGFFAVVGLPAPTSEVQPAVGPDSLVLPSRIDRAGPWAASTEDAGPVGPLLAVYGASRSSWFSTSYGLTGVGNTQTHAFLDLPDEIDPNKPYALSPDGRWVGYLATRSDDTGPVTYAVAYDSTTEEHTDIALPEVPDWSALVWSDRSLWVQSDSADKTLAWNPTTGERRTLTGQIPELWAASAYGDNLVAVNQQGSRRQLLLLDEGRPVVLGRFDRTVEGPVVLSDDGQRVLATVQQTEDAPGTVSSGGPLDAVVGELPPTPQGVILTAPVGGTEADQEVRYAAGWRDSGTVVVSRTNPDPEDFTGQFVALDVDASADARPSVLAENTLERYYAPKIWQAPLVPGVAPAAAGDPRARIAVWLGFVMLLGGAAWRWRRARV